MHIFKLGSMSTIQLSFVLATFFTSSLAVSVRAEKLENFQPGYIIIGRDTVKGFIQVGDGSLNTNRCIFKETPAGPERTYSPDELRGYGVNAKSFFYSAGIGIDHSMEHKVFLECLVKSSVSLFFFRDRFFIDTENGLEELVEVTEEIRKDGKAFTVKRPYYKSVLQQDMEDCPTIHENLVDAHLTKKSLVALFKNYASCAGHRATVFESKDPENNGIRYGFTLGLLMADLKLKSADNVRYSFGEHASGSPSVTFTPSFFVEFRISNRFDLCTGLNLYYTKNELEARSSATNLSHNFLLEASRIEVPLLLKYSLSKNNVKWSLKAGCGFDGLIKYKNRLIVSTTSSGFVLDKYNNDLKKNGFLLNPMGGVCAEFSLGNRSLLVEGCYSKSGSLVQTGTEARLEGFKISIGMFL